MRIKIVKNLLILGGIGFLMMFSIVSHAHDASEYTLETWNTMTNDNEQGRNWFFMEDSHIPETLGTQNNPLLYYFNDMGIGSESHLNLSSFTYQKNSRNLMWSNIKPILRKGVQKWNNVYFRDGSVDKRLIYIEETTSLNNANVVFYPSAAKPSVENEMYDDLKYTVIQNSTYTYIGTTEKVDESCVDLSDTYEEHQHCTKYQIVINIRELIKEETTHSLLMLKTEKIGTHEIGHVLGLTDIEHKESSYVSHPELIMSSGYSDDNHTLDIPYQEVVGVAILRGLHTDEEHQWVEESYNGETRYKCIICNGYTSVNPGGIINSYGHTDGHSHNHEVNELMIVGKIKYAKYGEHYHYYKKCIQCSYVVALSDNISYKNVITNTHTIVCNDCKMEWIKTHTFEYDSTNRDTHTSRCVVCNYLKSQTTHTYVYTSIDDSTHNCYCSICDYSNTFEHDMVYDVDLQKYICVDCGYSE